MLFGNPAARLAAFLRDLVAGAAWQRPIWRDFDGVSALALSPALTAVLLRAPATGLAALAELRPAEAARLIGRLAEPDARRVLAGVLGGVPGAGPGAATRAGGAAGPGAAALGAFAPHAVDWVARAPLAVRGVPARLALALAVASPEARTAAAALGAEGAMAVLAQAAARRAGPAASDGARPLPSASAPFGAAAIEAALGPARAAAAARPPGPARGPAPQEVAAFHTPFGGVFLLWPHLLALPGSPDDATRLAVAAHALGLPAGESLAGDAALATLLCGDPGGSDLPLPEDAATLDAWAAEEGVTAAAEVPLGAGGAALLVAHPHGYWLRRDARAGAATAFPATTAERPAFAHAADWATLMPGADPATGQAAQIVLRRFAYRLPGFATSSVAFLRDNLLAMEALVQVGPKDGIEGGIDAALGPVPLSIMLNLTGLARQRLTLPDGRILRLSQAERP